MQLPHPGVIKRRHQKGRGLRFFSSRHSEKMRAWPISAVKLYAGATSIEANFAPDKDGGGCLRKKAAEVRVKP
jgi:hypothetical protein